ncbi:hypothetical protein P153DRAFT_206353 [Dothidotthia symphoricarpi CBS 119687]|uniref:Rad21/Rec8-like protein N-terminal domain-containing protein n=1 Tax=Dothidotthia symphoricarpi CBS 119687 TaxID=1392245 RepID=A0A6A6AI06_9PLEO|nr:uncharacterized protein P153DRAFT_206353 [Dothidotthia symphoricarpi CBS 119687]KAF2130883.1 hypothetical protein P153DRAFT_206353 [Dothidotthia symphoricarpi CBS 119687]
MFYSHEVLTNRKYGVATVWLVATLGNKSSLKKINRKQILDVDVTKACRTVVDPVAPMALRLQGNLLYGVSRVYLQQCGYVLSDAQNVQSQIRVLLRTVKNAGLDPEAGKARPEQLVLPDDPYFLPGFDLPPPELLAEFGLDFGPDQLHSGDSQALISFASQRSQSSQASAIGGLVLPSSSSGVPGDFQIEGDNGPGSVGGRSGMLGADNMMLDLADPDFTFDANGELVDFPPRSVMSGTPAMSGGAAMLSDAGASARVRREHEDGQQFGVQIPGDLMDLDLPNFADDLPDDSVVPASDQQQHSDQPEILESTSSVSAPMRRKKRAARVLPSDAAMEIHNRDLADWNLNYLQNMEVASRTKNRSHITQQAKKNAEYYMWGSGVGGIAHGFLGPTGTNPFDRFIGDNFFELFTGMSRKPVAGSKHDRDSGIDEATQQESRRVRHKTGESEEQIGRGAEDEGFFMPGGDEIELPREAGSALDDQHIFSAMPWNMSASIRGSSAVPRSGRGGVIGSGRGSRLVSASPLLGRGQPIGLDVLRSLDSDAFGGDDFGLLGPSSDYPEPAPPLQPSARVREALSAEGENFLTFVTDAITEKRSQAQYMSDDLQAAAIADIDEVSFEELLPPTENTKMIACQGFLMVLALGTKGMLDVQQPLEFGVINLKLTQKARAMQVVEISDGESSGEEDESEAADPVGQEAQGDEEMSADGEDESAQEDELEQEEGHFDEQFAAGHAAYEDDDRDSLYDD